MPRKSVDAKTLRFLFGKSGNKCAFPDCCEPIFEDDGTLTGECCHIEAFSRGGARYNPETAIEDKNAEGNLILLCSRHHKIIDSHPQEYTTVRLKEIKQQHEKQYLRDTRELNDKMLFALRQSMKNYWRELQEIDKLADDGLKIPINPNIGIVSLISVLEDYFEEFEFIINQLRYDDMTTLDDLESLCEAADIDFAQFDKIPYYENPLWNRSWEPLNIAFPNKSREFKLIFLQLSVKILEGLSVYNDEYKVQLEQYKQKLKEFHEHNYYND